MALEAEFRERPPHTVAEAAGRIKTWACGGRRRRCACPSKKSLPGWRRMGAIAIAVAGSARVTECVIRGSRALRAVVVLVRRLMPVRMFVARRIYTGP
ncbi:hypothetical protein GobsT_55250 [Gemmata obscuriglobus]|nr:hypothetical protein GobsT_55250 [Gemmata obscuriglobus]VTS10041.1 unnamed protein product [Gemmata obscuriglobus UQM 2246]